MLPPNYKIDQRYDVVKVLGEGFSGEVALVRDAEGLKALKFLKKVQMGVSREEGLRNFKNEFAILKELNHPNIARIVDFGLEPRLQKYFFTTEFVPGAEFHKAVEGQPFDVLERLLVEILRALNYLHARGVYHFDIKPQNILVGMTDGVPQTAKLIDFGLAGYGSPGKKVGTAAYMAPEIISGGVMDGRADLYSFGVMVYKLFTGVSPYSGKSQAETLANHLNVTPPPMHTHKEGIPAYWEHVVAHLLEKDPNKRYAQAALVIRDLNFLSGKEFAFETTDTKFSYLPEKGALIGRDAQWQNFTGLFAARFEGEEPTAENMLVVSGARGTGKTRLLAEAKYFAQLRAIPVRTLDEFDALGAPDAFVLIVDDDAGVQANRVTALAQEYAAKRCLILWAVEAAPANWQNVRVAKLAAYDDAQLKAYIESVLGMAQAPDTLIAEIRKRTQGNPLFVTEFIRALLAQDALLDSKTGKWNAATFQDVKIDFDAIEVPTTIEECLRQEFTRRSDDERELLSWLAVSSEPLNAGCLGALQGHQAIRNLLIELVRAGLLEADAESGKFDFKNRLMREVIRHNLPAYDQRLRHDRLGSWFATVPGAARVALFHRGHGSDPELAVASLWALGTEQMASQEYAAATETFERLVQLTPISDAKWCAHQMTLGRACVEARHLPRAIAVYSGLVEKFRAAGAQSTPEYLTALERLIDARIKAGESAQVGELIAEAKTLAVNSAQARVYDLLLRNHGAVGLLEAGQIDEARAIFEATQDVWQRELTPAEQGRVNNNKLLNVCILTQDYPAAIAIANSSIQVYEQSGDNVLLAHNHYALGDIYFSIMVREQKLSDQVMVANCREHFLQAESFGRKAERPGYIFRALNGIGVLHHHCDQLDEARKYYERALVLAQKCEIVHAASIAKNIGMIHKMQGNFSDAYAYILYALNTLQNQTDKNTYTWQEIFKALIELAEIYRVRQDFAQTHHSLEQAEALLAEHDFLAEQVFFLHYERALAHHCQGQTFEAQGRLALAVKAAHNDFEREKLAELQAALGVDSPQAPAESSADQSTVCDELTARRQRLLKEAQTSAGKTDSAAEIYRIVLQTALAGTQAEVAHVIVREDDGMFRLAASMPEGNQDSSSLSVVRRVFADGVAVCANEAGHDPRFEDSVSAVLGELKSVLCTLIRAGDDVVGVLYLANNKTVGAFTDADKTFAVTLAELCAIKLLLPEVSISF